MKLCQYCHQELAEDAYICAVCGRIVQWMTHYSPTDTEPTYPPMHPFKRRLVRPLLLWFAAFIIFLLVPVLAAGQSLQAQAEQRSAQNRAPTQVALSGVFIDKLSYPDRVVVRGTVKNVSKRNLEGVMVAATVINSLDQEIGTVGVAVEQRLLLPGEEAAFSLTIPVAVEQALRVRVKVVRVREQVEIRRIRKWSGVTENII